MVREAVETAVNEEVMCRRQPELVRCPPRRAEEPARAQCAAPRRAPRRTHVCGARRERYRVNAASGGGVM